MPGTKDVLAVLVIGLVRVAPTLVIPASAYLVSGTAFPTGDANNP